MSMRSNQRVAGGSIDRNAWRAELYREEVAAEFARHRHAAAMHRAVMIGVAIGVLGSLANFI